MLAKKDNIFILEGQGKISAVKTWQPWLTPREKDWVAGSRGGRRLFSVCLFEPCMYYLLSKNEKTDKTKYKTQLLLTQGDVGGRGRRQPRIRISGEVTGRTAPAAMTWAPQPCSPPTSHAH